MAQRKLKSVDSVKREKKDTIEVLYKGEVIDDKILITSDTPKEEFDFAAAEQTILKSTMEMYPIENGQRQYSIISSATNSSSDTFTLSDLNQVVVGINSTLTKVLKANSYILQSILLDAFMGRAYEIIYSNINTDYRLIYPELNKDDNEETFNQVKDEIDNFNKFTNIKNIIREAVMGVFREGNYSLYLRLENNDKDITSAVIDHYPLELCYPSGYLIDGESILEFNIASIKKALRNSYPKTRSKKKEAIYFEEIKKEIEANFPKEIVEAYTSSESIVRLNDRYTGYMKVNDMGSKFGVSPFLKALKPLVVLNNIEAADVADSKTRSKKIIFQKLRKELMGSNGERKGFAEMQYAHEAAAKALKTNFCLYTAPAYVEDLSYVIDKSTNDNSSDSITTYTSKMLTALGIGFSDSELSSYSIANISVDQLMKTINAITKQIERIISKFYCVYIEDLGLPKEFAPEILISDTELMEWNLKKEFAQFAYSTLNASRDTVFKIIGLNIEDEKQRRIKENSENLDSVFSPRPTAYNTGIVTDTENSGNLGRPTSSEDTGKQEFDKEYSKEVRQ